ncbi:VTT domain-containing protein [Nibricoccus sp. IMCC34717]|uniref:VTT domain-containing protein n=1 Tax=Nibricoccus sp. IMCC34717 TaxID=3034021 RepID=UPI0038505A6B
MLALILVPFALLGGGIERFVATLQGRPLGGAEGAMLVVGSLTADAVLPVPSSVVLVWSGKKLGTAAGAAAGTTGLVGGGMFAWWLGRLAARGRCTRLISDEQRTQLDRVFARWGGLTLALTRAIPVIAEAAAFLAGLAGVPAHRSLTSLVLGSAPVALAYAVSGAASTDREWVSWLVAVVLPAGAWLAWRSFVRKD